MNILPKLITLLETDPSNQVKIKALYAISCEYPLLQHSGWISTFLHQETTAITFTTCILLYTLCVHHVCLCFIGSYWMHTFLWNILQRWLYCREHLKCVWNVHCVVTNHRRDPRTTETTGNEQFPVGHGTNYLHGKLIIVTSCWLLKFFFLKSNDVLDAVLSTGLGKQRCFKFLIRHLTCILEHNKNNLFRDR